MPTDRPHIVYHLVSREQYEKDLERHKAQGVFMGDQRDGFLHMSVREEVARSAGLYMSSVRDLAALEIDLRKCTARIEWDYVESRKCEFQHSYGSVPLDAIVRVIDIPYDEQSTSHDLSQWDTAA